VSGSLQKVIDLEKYVMRKVLVCCVLVAISTAAVYLASKVVVAIYHENLVRHNTAQLLNSSSVIEIEKQVRAALESAHAITVRIKKPITMDGRDPPGESVRLNDRSFFTDLATDFSVVSYTKRPIVRTIVGSEVHTLEFHALVPYYLLVDVEGEHRIRFRAECFDIVIEGSDDVIRLEVNPSFCRRLYKHLNLEDQ
jgi:hypothetical protein